MADIWTQEKLPTEINIQNTNQLVWSNCYDFFFFFTDLTVKMVSKMLTLLASAETKILVHEFL